jgi:putative addiction module antidote
MTRKIFKTGNSMVVSLPASAETRLGVGPGSEVDVVVDEEQGVIIIKPVRPPASGVTPEFSQLIDEFIEEYRPVLEKLAE